MADFESLKQLVKDSQATHRASASTIRSLIQQRDAAIFAAKPADVEKAKEVHRVATEATELQDGLESARKEADAAISEAGKAPIAPAKPAVPVPPYPKTLGDSTTQNRTSLVVNNASEEAAARAQGFTVTS